MTDTPVLNVENFIRQCVERAGGVVDERQPGLLDALLPAPLEALAGGKSLLPLALEPDKLTVEPQAELAILGSPWMDGLIAYATEHGRAATCALVPERLKKKGLREEVERTLIFSNCRIRYTEGEPDTFYGAIAQFNFRIEFFSDERRERLVVIPVNLCSNQPVLPLVEKLPFLHTEPNRSSLISEAKHVPLEQGYQTALTVLRQEVERESEQHLARMRKRFIVEFSRISDYYAGVAGELERRREREDDEGRLKSLDQKLEAAHREREHKLHELGDKNRLRRRARLASVRLLFQPKTFYKLHLDRGHATRTLTLAYDSILERLEPPPCDRCHQETTRIHVTSNAEMLCPVCAGVGR